jgi:hypothetical protein
VLAKQEAIKLVYHARIGPKSTIFGFRIIAAFDSSFYYFNYEAFNDDYEAYAKIVDSIVVSVKLPKPKVRSADPNEAAKPSPDVRTFSSEDIEIQHPDNFEPSFPKDKGKAIFAVSFMGPIRQDCFVTLGIFPSNKNKLDKIVEDNIKVFKSTGTTDAKIDGNDAKYLTVSPASGIKQRVYFAVKGDKMYRVIITWASSVEKDFLPSFEKMINSLKLK